MSNNTNPCGYMLFLLCFGAFGLNFLFAVFTLVLTNDNNHMLMDATIDYGRNTRTFRVASCDVGTCEKEKIFWKTVVMPVSTVTETATVYVPGHDSATRPATAEMEDVEPTTLVPQILPTEGIKEPERKKFSIRGMRNGHVDVNKPEMQM
ncbi:uncharacterized protein M437DRAFT_80796 [Aureobasidium melanogenum CBS 110374]|uniref:Uncharacterized protein n=1 Tax=Aureobasidium melanogenum (strain CBS 110374) TaxID=1043003 RepID=A0A074WV76_AURM1|nr:uncharacterized protein M437DRAFT_80796 [Aureobasidium melanogenum CBS 110374]KEQ66301.1 hypothetical protein M437DRAFT_80796 [Aureobasidium melanogenum CBS 110374]